MANSTRNKGFTLIEVLMVISVIAIIIGIGTVSYRQVMKDNIETTLKNDISTNMMQYKLEDAEGWIYSEPISSPGVEAGFYWAEIPQSPWRKLCFYARYTETGKVMHAFNGEAAQEGMCPPERPLPQ